MWDTDAIIAWLNTLNLGIELFPAAEMYRDMPDELGFVTLTTGPGLSLEDIADTSGFQLRIRGKQNDPASTEALALAADKKILNAGYPLMVGDVRLQLVRRSGGRPTPLSPNPDSGSRTEYVCTYLTTVLEE